MTPEDLLDFDLRLPSGTTAALINRHLAGTPMAGLGYTFLNVETRYRVNARYFVAHAIHESNWGRSNIARDKKNLFGFGAYDHDPYRSAKEFTSFEGCIDYVGRYIAREYLTPGGRYFVKPTLRGMNQHYATDPEWGIKIARLMLDVPQVQVFVNGNPVSLDQLMLVSGQVYVPVRQAFEAAGAFIQWQDEGVHITTDAEKLRGILNRIRQIINEGA